MDTTTTTAPGVSPLTGQPFPAAHGHARMPERGQCTRCDAYRDETRRNLGR